MSRPPNGGGINGGTPGTGGPINGGGGIKWGSGGGGNTPSNGDFGDSTRIGEGTLLMSLGRLDSPPLPSTALPEPLKIKNINKYFYLIHILFNL